MGIGGAFEHAKPFLESARGTKDSQRDSVLVDSWSKLLSVARREKLTLLKRRTYLLLFEQKRHDHSHSSYRF